MLERAVEQRLRQKVAAAGGLCLKFVSPGNAGVPDRLIVLPGGVVAFVEVKRPGEKLRPLQVHWQSVLGRLGLPSACCDSATAVDAMVATLVEESRGRK